MESNPVYEHLGIEPLINAFGTMTHIGGSLMAPEVTAAMAEASRSFVPLRQLQERVGERLAELTGAEAAFISAGAASGAGAHRQRTADAQLLRGQHGHLRAHQPRELLRLVLDDGGRCDWQRRRGCPNG